MSLNDFMQPKKERHVSLKAALKILRGKWYKGEVSRFDEKLASILECSLEDAEIVRDDWLECEILGINRRGLLVWKTGGF